MRISINGESRELSEGVTIREMLDHLSLPPRRMAIELNKQVLRRQEWETTELKERDELEIVHFVGGG